MFLVLSIHNNNFLSVIWKIISKLKSGKSPPNNPRFNVCILKILDFPTVFRKVKYLLSADDVETYMAPVSGVIRSGTIHNLLFENFKSLQNFQTHKSTR